jgi:dihydroorotase
MRTFDPLYRVNPPLRSADIAAGLLEALKSGIIAAIATDHAPHRLEEKELELTDVPSGFQSIECAFSALYTKLVLERKLELAALIERLTAGPAEILGLSDRGCLAPGRRADIAIIDLNASWTIGEHGYASRSTNCPYHGWHVKGVMKHTICQGRIVYSA